MAYRPAGFQPGRQMVGRGLQRPNRASLGGRERRGPGCVPGTQRRCPRRGFPSGWAIAPLLGRRRHRFANGECRTARLSTFAAVRRSPRLRPPPTATMGNRSSPGVEDRTARLWRTAGGEELAALRGHRALVKCVAFHADGATLVTAGSDKTVRFWPSPGTRGSPDTARTYPLRLHGGLQPERPVVRLGRHETKSFASGTPPAASRSPSSPIPRSFVACLAISPDGNRLVARSWDGRHEDMGYAERLRSFSTSRTAGSIARRSLTT